MMSTRRLIAPISEGWDGSDYKAWRVPAYDKLARPLAF
jgi:hypothetical protein